MSPLKLSVMPLQAFFRPGEPIRLRIDGLPTHSAETRFELRVFHLSACIFQRVIAANGPRHEPALNLPVEEGRGYLVCVSTRESETVQAFTAFDVLSHWTQAPRYGNLFDFRPGRTDTEATLDHLLRLHVNGLQFYDWQYRHDTLLPPQDEFTDPLGRPLSLATVRTLIDGAHARGMAALPYTAIYGASPAFSAAHPDWLLYDSAHVPVDFAEGFLKIMNTRSPEWREHFVAECRRVLEALPFDGIHVDQYGEPRTGFDQNSDPVDVGLGFAEILAALRQAVPPEKAVLFNLVHNWPSELIAGSPLDFWYSELWPPVTDLRQLATTIRDNRRLRERPAVLAVYIPPEREQTVIAAHSTILAAGGQHIAHGDHGSYLSDPYFPKAGMPSEALAAALQRMADFAVAYEEGLSRAHDIGGDQSLRDVIRVAGQPFEHGQVIVRVAGARLFISIVNAEGHWDTALTMPAPLSGAELHLSGAWRSAWTATPEEPLPVALNGIALPPIHGWRLVCLEFDDPAALAAALPNH